MAYQSYFEIHQSYNEMKKTLDEVISNKTNIKSFFENKDEIVFIGCGSSYWLSLSLHSSFALRTGKKAYAVKAGEVVMSPKEYERIYQNPTFVAPSRSGKSKELLDALDLLKKFYPNAKIMSVTEYLDNPLQKISDLNISIPWADEISVCQTRSFNSLATAFIGVVGLLSDESLLQNLQKYITEAPELYSQIERQAKEIVQEMDAPEIVALGSGIQYGITIEGAYIIVEMAEHLAAYYQILEYRHGPIVTANKNTFVFISSTKTENADYEYKMAKEIQNKGAKIIMCGNETSIDDLNYNFTISNDYQEEIRALYYVAMMQSVAFHLSVKKGVNPDSPGDLVKFIVY